MPIANARMYSVTPKAKADWKTLLAWVLARADLDWPLVDHDAPAPMAALWSRDDLGAVMMCGLPFARRTAPATLIVAPVPSPVRYGGHPVYATDLVVAAGSRHARIEDTFGGVLGITLADSFSGGVAPLAYLDRFRDAQRAPLFRATVDGLIHARGVIEAIAAGRIDLGPLDGWCHDLLVASDPAFAAQVRTLTTTPMRPIPPFVATAPLAPDVLDRLRAAFLATAEADELAGPMRRLCLRGFLVPEPQAYVLLADIARAGAAPAAT